MQQPTTTSAPFDEKLKSLVPLLQTVAWAFLMGASLFGFRKEVAGLLAGRNQ